ncbi:MAG: PF20097 family protein [Thermoplasmata archaeon]
MSESNCTVCGKPLEAGFVTSTNGSGLFWSHDSEPSRFRPKGLEVLVPTGFGVTSSANLPGQRCANCQTILVQLKPRP